MKNILIIYTGGTIGMVPTENGYSPKEGYFMGALEKIGIEAHTVRDLWRQKDIPTDVVYQIPSHGVLYVKVK